MVWLAYVYHITLTAQVGVQSGISLHKKNNSVTQREKQPLFKKKVLLTKWYLATLFAYAYTELWEQIVLALDARICMCKLVWLARWLWVVEKYNPLSCRVRCAQYPVVVVLFGLMGVQEGVSGHLILFAICSPVGTQVLLKEQQHLFRHWNMTFSWRLIRSDSSLAATTCCCLGVDWE